MFTKALREVLPGDLQRNESSFPQTLSQMAALVYASALTTQWDRNESLPDLSRKSTKKGGGRPTKWFGKFWKQVSLGKTGWWQMKIALYIQAVRLMFLTTLHQISRGNRGLHLVDRAANCVCCVHTLFADRQYPSHMSPNSSSFTWALTQPLSPPSIYSLKSLRDNT